MSTLLLGGGKKLSGGIYMSVCLSVLAGCYTLARVHNKGREESVEHAIRVYNNSSESNVTSCRAHVIVLNAKNSKFLLNTKKGPVFRSFRDIFCLYAWFLWRYADIFTR